MQWLTGALVAQLVVRLTPVVVAQAIGALVLAGVLTAGDAEALRLGLCELN